MKGPSADAIGRLLEAGLAQQKAGRLAVARVSYAEVLAIDPRNFDALQLSGLCALQAGENAEARQLLDRALALRQDVASVFNHRGVALRRLGDNTGALADFSRSAALAPQAADPRYNRGNTLRELGRLNEALEAYNQAAALAPGRTDILNNLGGCLKELKLHGDALACYDRLLTLAPGTTEVHVNRGVVLHELGRFEEAFASQDRAIAIDPHLAEAWRKRAAALIPLDRAEEAVESADRAISLEPDNPDAHATRGAALMALEQAGDAAASFMQALALKADSIDARLGLARLASEQGRFGEAEQLFEAVRRDDPGNVGSLQGLSGVRKFAAGDPLFQAIADRLRDGNLSADESELLHHGFAKICNDAGRLDDAMAHFAVSKRCRASRFDLALHRASLARLKQLFTPAFFAARQGFGLTDERPVFVVGMPRSGTTLTEQILSAHALVQGLGELQDMAKIAKTLRGGLAAREAFAAAVEELDAEAARALALRYLEAYRGADAGMLRLVDKRPHNYELLGLIALLFPRARIIHCRRNPMDNCLSMYMQHFNVSHGYNRDLATLGHYYRAYEDLMAHWRAVLPLPIHECSYEATVDDVEASARGLVSFVGLDWDPACLDYHRQEGQVRTPSQWQVRQPVYRSSVEAWRRYEKYLKPLKDALDA